ncbi:chemotaxis protein CheC [Thiohalorhabdus sp.]|uniref:chemotaxis protein CheC n=1 Tax=Thiohalorhabdus sp. TaxID=3094134 RepID=UPI002FC3117C
MTAAPELSEEQQDALTELVNVAMGQAASALSQLLGTFIKLHVPSVRVVDARALRNHMDEGNVLPDQVSGVSQAFFDQIRGEALALYDLNGSDHLASLLGEDKDPGDLAPEDEDELLLDASNIVTGAILTGLGEQLGSHFSFTAPSLLGKECETSDLLDPTSQEWDKALLVEVRFAAEERAFECRILLIMLEESIDTVRGLVDGILADL